MKSCWPINFQIISTTFQHHFKICLLWFLHEKECCFYTHLFCCTEMRWLFISSTAIWVTVSDRIPVQLLPDLEVNLLDQNVYELEFELFECRRNNPLVVIVRSQRVFILRNFCERWSNHFGAHKLKFILCFDLMKIKSKHCMTIFVLWTKLYMYT